MRRFRSAIHALAALLVLSGLALACSSDSPTRPRPEGGPPPAGGGDTTFAVTVTTSAAELLVSSEQTAIITVSVRRNDNGQPPPNGATVTVTTNRGSFGTADSGTQSVVLSLTNGAVSVELFGGDAVGTAIVQASISGNFGQTQVRIVEEAAFALGSVQPNSGSPEGGETVVISGQGFAGPVQVVFDFPSFAQEAPAQVLSVTPTQITIRTPPTPQTVGVGETVNVNVQVAIRVGTETQNVQTLNGAFIYALGGTLLRPVISLVTPNAGPNEGGTRVRIAGDGFEAPVQVIFGTGDSPNGFQGIEATVVSVTRMEIVAVSPSATGIGQDNRNRFVNVLVRNQRSGAANISPAAFQYGQSNVFISSIGPGTGPHFGGTIVTLFGSGFDEPVAVDFVGVAATVISVTGSEVIARTNAVIVNSCSDITGPARVVNIETSDTASFNSFTYLVLEPVVNSIDPTTLPQGGTTVTLTGVNFESPVLVTFGGRRGNNAVVSDDGTTITVDAPSFTGSFPTEDCTQGGLTGERSLPVAVDVVVTNSLTTCNDVLQDAVLYTPADTSCRIDPPTANFSFTANGTLVTFQNSSQNFTSSLWNFGDGGTSTATNPSHDYSSVPPGETATFNVVLTVSNTAGSDSITRQVTVTAPAPP